MAENDHRHAELLTRFTSVIGDIGRTKADQWQTTYYSLLLSSGVFALMFALLKGGNAAYLLKKWLIFSAVIYLSLAQGALVIKFQRSFDKSLRQFRSHAQVINNLLCEITHIYREINEKAEVKDRTASEAEDLSAAYKMGFTFFGLVGPLATLCYSLFKLIRCICGRGT
jgi:hypothetical protein